MILGDTGRNFAAGMSGGIAYIYDKSGEFSDKCNLSMVELEKPGKDDMKTIKTLLSDHFKFTKSQIAKKILDNFEVEIRRFIKVMPAEYRRVLEERELAEDSELAEVSDG